MPVTNTIEENKTLSGPQYETGIYREYIRGEHFVGLKDLRFRKPGECKHLEGQIRLTDIFHVSKYTLQLSWRGVI